LATAFGDSDDGGNDFVEDISDNRDEVQAPDSIDKDSIYQPSLPVVVADRARLLLYGNGKSSQRNSFPK
jgi:hypothetical protein